MHGNSEQLRDSPFEYLFSIGHLEIIPDHVLQIPQRAAINFHDGLLPQYAGLNVPTWAILNHEHMHGVTWHLMTVQADAGDILQQASFPISAQETALTLNAKCFDAGMSTFVTLIDNLDTGTIEPKPQDLTKRHNFLRSDRPSAACFIDWRLPAIDIDALVRATYFGQYANPVGAAKFSISGHTIVATSCRVLPGATTDSPGTIVAVNDHQLRVATGQGLLALEAIAELDGTSLSIRDLATRHTLCPGMTLFPFTDVEAARFSAVNRRLAAAEDFWTQRLESLRPTSAIAIQHHEEARSEVAHQAFTPPSSFLERFTESPGDAVAAAFAAFLAVAANSWNVDLACEYIDENSADPRDAHWLSSRLLLRLFLNSERGFDDALKTWSVEKDLCSRRGVWPRDLIGRMPSLRARSELRGGVPDIVGVRLGTPEQVQVTPTDWSSLVLSVNTDDAHCTWSWGRSRYSTESINHHASRFYLFLERIATDPQMPLDDLIDLTKDEEQKLLSAWNQTDQTFPRELCVHELFEEQVAQDPGCNCRRLRQRTPNVR